MTLQLTRTILALCGAVLLAACATTTESPVADDFKKSLRFSSVDVTFAEDRAVPGVYDKAVRNVLDSTEATTLNKSAFQSFVNERGGKGVEDNQLGERYLEYRIAEEVTRRLQSSLAGTDPVDLRVNIEKILTPNAATMVLVGEIKGITYDLDVVRAGTDTVLLDLSEVSKPFVDRSAGAGGGVTGLLLRTGKNTNLNDLEQMVAAVAEEISQILTGAEVNKSVAKKIRRAGM